MASGDRRDTSREATELSESPSSQSKKDQGKKPKAGSSKKMTKKEQSERFIEANRRLGLDESGDVFDQTLSTVLHSQKDSR